MQNINRKAKMNEKIWVRHNNGQATSGYSTQTTLRHAQRRVTWPVRKQGLMNLCWIRFWDWCVKDSRVQVWAELISYFSYLTVLNMDVQRPKHTIFLIKSMLQIIIRRSVFTCTLMQVVFLSMCCDFLFFFAVKLFVHFRKKWRFQEFSRKFQKVQKVIEDSRLFSIQSLVVTVGVWVQIQAIIVWWADLCPWMQCSTHGSSAARYGSWHRSLKWHRPAALHTHHTWSTACGKTTPVYRWSWQLLSPEAENILNTASSH